jgi:glutamate/aspartate transport system substrate-binding protein
MDYSQETVSMNTRISTLLATAVTLCLLTSAPCTAAPPSPAGTLEKAKSTGTITIGYRLANVPFSYLDNTFLPTGYAKELCDRVVDTIRQEYNLPKLKISYFPVKADDRITALQNGTIDMECGSSTITTERRKQVDFSLAYFIAHIRLLARKDSHIQDLTDLANKTLVVTKGTTAANILRGKLSLTHPDINLMEGKTHSDSFLIVAGGRAAAYATDDILLAGLIANSRQPEAYEIVGPPLSSESYAIMLRKDDEPLKTIVNLTLTRLMLSGEAPKLYNRWFMNPIPPSGIVINLPMSAELQQAFTPPDE